MLRYAKSSIGLLTNAVQALAGVLLPSDTVFLRLLRNDRAVLGQWVNSRGLNLFTGATIAVLVMLSMTLTLAVLFPGITDRRDPHRWGHPRRVVAIGVRLAKPAFGPTKASQDSVAPTALLQRDHNTWRMPPLGEARLGTPNSVRVNDLRTSSDARRVRFSKSCRADPPNPRRYHRTGYHTTQTGQPLALVRA